MDEYEYYWCYIVKAEIEVNLTQQTVRDYGVEDGYVTVGDGQMVVSCPACAGECETRTFDLPVVTA